MSRIFSIQKRARYPLLSYVPFICWTISFHEVKKYGLGKNVHTETIVAIADFWRKFYHDGEKSALAYEGGGGGARPAPFTQATITYKVAVYAPAERADTLILFNLWPYTVCIL